MVNPQVLSEQQRHELVELKVPFDQFSIADSNNMPVDFDLFRPEMRIDLDPKQERIENLVSIPVSFTSGEQYKLFFVKREHSNKEQTTQHIQL